MIGQDRDQIFWIKKIMKEFKMSQTEFSRVKLIDLLKTIATHSENLYLKSILIDFLKKELKNSKNLTDSEINSMLKLYFALDMKFGFEKEIFQMIFCDFEFLHPINILLIFKKMKKLLFSSNCQLSYPHFSLIIKFISKNCDKIVFCQPAFTQINRIEYKRKIFTTRDDKTSNPQNNLQLLAFSLLILIQTINLLWKRVVDQNFVPRKYFSLLYQLKTLKSKLKSSTNNLEIFNFESLIEIFKSNDEILVYSLIPFQQVNILAEILVENIPVDKITILKLICEQFEAEYLVEMLSLNKFEILRLFFEYFRINESKDALGNVNDCNTRDFFMNICTLLENKEKCMFLKPLCQKIRAFFKNNEI